MGLLDILLRRDTFTMNDTHWQGEGNIEWCRLFVGDRFHMAGGMHSAAARANALPKPERNGNNLVIPQAQIKDLVSMREHTRVFSSSQQGTNTQDVVDIQLRKITTTPLTVDVLKGCRAMYVDNSRFFLDPENGPLSAQEAFKCVINNDTDDELFMNENLFVNFLEYINTLNDSGGYAVCEVTELRNQQHWYGVRRIIMLGMERGRAPVELQTGVIPPIGSFTPGKTVHP